jgi:cytochrome c biogenesis protein CcmG, thiol:disulfide interchange protein DsbE
MDMKSIVSEDTRRKPQTTEEIFRRSRKRHMIIFAATCVLCAALLVLIWSQLVTPASSQPSTSTDNTSSTPAVNSGSNLLVGKTAPDFTLPAVNGGSQVHLASFKGKPVVLNFWASWCDPCNQEAPVLSQAAADMKAKGVVMLGVDGPENIGNARAFIQKYGVTYQNVQDSVNSTTAISYGVTAFPETFFINKDGIVVEHSIAPFTSLQEFQQELAKITQ